jgi:glycosyltransferase involved in cell wall biosynthesis
MRLLHVLAERGFSGGEVQLRYLLAHLVARGHDNRLILQPGARFAATASALGIPTEEIRMRGSADPLAIAGLRGAMRRARPDLVHLACSRSHKLGALAAIGLRGAARVATRRMDYPLRRGPWSRWLYGRAVDRCVAISDAIGRELARAGVPSARVVRIYEGVDADEFADLRAQRAALLARLGWPDDAFVCLCAASLRPRKGQVHLLRAFATASGRAPHARLLLAGEGDARASLEAEAARLDLGDRVRLPGQLPREQALGAADLACIPSLQEGLSVFSLEAMAAGLPVLASAVGGLPESVDDGVSGLLAPPGDEPAWAAALGRLLADADLCRRMGEAGRRRARTRFAAATMAAENEKLYEELVATRRR